MSKLRKDFSEKEWKECCGNFCKDCKIAVAFREKYGKKEGDSTLSLIIKKETDEKIYCISGSGFYRNSIYSG
jgi:hypothetical protein